MSVCSVFPLSAVFQSATLPARRFVRRRSFVRARVRAYWRGKARREQEEKSGRPTRGRNPEQEKYRTRGAELRNHLSALLAQVDK